VSVLQVDALSTVYQTAGGVVSAVDDVSFSLDRGEVLGVVGESGCGKTTLAMSLLRLIKPPGKIVHGAVLLDGISLFSVPRARMGQYRGRHIALVPQASLNALDPLCTAIRLVSEVIAARGELSRRQAVVKATDLLGSLGIPLERVHSYPHELSGGMRQRVAIGIAIANDPLVLVADEPVTGLDVIVQAQIVDLLLQMKQQHGLSMVFITHDLSTVLQFCDRLLVMYAGRVAEYGPARRVADAPKHPYTKALLDACPRVDGPKRLITPIPGDIPGLVNPPTGCRFHPRCPSRFAPCSSDRPNLLAVEEAHDVACHLYPTSTIPS
jgi:peptide/nickel transport system ATP-binding protein